MAWYPIFRSSNGGGMPMGWQPRSTLVRALQDMNEAKNPLTRVFSYQFNRITPGLRRFFAMTEKDIVQTVLFANKFEKHIYEVITFDHPNKGYFDLEFDVECNVDKDKEVMLEKFISMVTYTFKKHYHIEMNRQDMIILESCTKEKASYHIICNNAFESVFEHNSQMRQFCSLLSEGYGPEHTSLPKHCRDMVVTTKNGFKTFFYDSGVYTNNRSFRLPFNSKLEKEKVLLLHATCDYYTSKGLFGKPKDILVDSLISCVKPVDRDQFIVTSDMNTIFYNNLSRSFVKINEPKASTSSSVVGTSKAYSTGSVPQLFTPKGLLVNSKGPYPQLYDYIDEWVKQSNPKCRVYGFKGSRDDILMEYYVMYPMVCDFMNRSHQNNGVFYIVDTVTEEMWQRCHDEVCKYTRKEEPQRFQLKHKLFEQVKGSLTRTESAPLTVKAQTQSGVIDCLSLNKTDSTATKEKREIMVSVEDAIEFLVDRREDSDSTIKNTSPKTESSLSCGINPKPVSKHLSSEANEEILEQDKKDGYRDKHVALCSSTLELIVDDRGEENHDELLFEDKAAAILLDQKILLDSLETQQCLVPYELTPERKENDEQEEVQEENVLHCSESRITDDIPENKEAIISKSDGRVILETPEGERGFFTKIERGDTTPEKLGPHKKITIYDFVTMTYKTVNRRVPPSAHRNIIVLPWLEQSEGQSHVTVEPLDLSSFSTPEKILNKPNGEVVMFNSDANLNSEQAILSSNTVKLQEKEMTVTEELEPNVCDEKSRTAMIKKNQIYDLNQRYLLAKRKLHFGKKRKTFGLVPCKISDSQEDDSNKGSDDDIAYEEPLVADASLASNSQEVKPFLTWNKTDLIDGTGNDFDGLCADDVDFILNGVFPLSSDEDEQSDDIDDEDESVANKRRKINVIAAKLDHLNSKEANDKSSVVVKSFGRGPVHNSY